MPTHRKASVAQSHPGRKPRWEAAGHLLVKEETLPWAPWTRPTLGCISHQPAHYQPRCNRCANPTTGLALPPASHSLWLQRWLGEDRSLGWSLFLPSEMQGHCQSGHISRLSFPSYKLRQDHFLYQAALWGIAMLADLGKAEAVDAVSFQIQLEALGQHPMPCLSLCTRLANLRTKPGANSGAPRPVFLEGTSEGTMYPALPLKPAVEKTFSLPRLTPTIHYENIPVYE